MDRSDSEITWRRRQGRYSSVQDRTGIRPRARLGLPPARQRVTQDPTPSQPRFLDEREEVMRVTYQGDDRCGLACPGCYTGGRLTLTPAQALLQGRRKVVPDDEFVGHIEALGDGLQDFALLGAEATMDPSGSARKLRWALERGMWIHLITHGAVEQERLEETFGEALDSGRVYTIIVSLDSMVPEINNMLRGRPYAHRMTVQTIRHLVERGAPLKVQMTVWPRNYTTIVRSVQQLYDLGVRAFAFHHGSIEGVPRETVDRDGMEPVDALAWRALCEQLLAFRDEHRRSLRQFNVPFVYFTEAELRSGVIGEDALTAAYIEHVDRLERGEPSTKPVQACPALDVPQVYVYGNDGPGSHGSVSLCNVHNPEGASAYADYDPDLRRWRVRADPRTNQMQQMLDSPYLCPATPLATGLQSERIRTEAGDLYHACRYIASNQMDMARDLFGPRVYGDALAYYAQFIRALEVYGDAEPPMPRIRRVTAGITNLAARARALAADLDAIEAAGGRDRAT